MKPISHVFISPNHESRQDKPIILIVWHSTVGTCRSSILWLCSRASLVSAHYVIDTDGTIYQIVPDNRAAWHAGVCWWNGMDSETIKLQSLSIELVNLNGTTTHNGATVHDDPYPIAQLQAAHALGRSLMAQYNIALANNVRHADIAIPIGRKTDPIGLPWLQFKASLAAPQQTTIYLVNTLPLLRAHVRAQPSTRAPIIDSLWRGTRVSAIDEVPGEGGVWIARLEGGYIRKDLLKVAA